MKRKVIITTGMHRSGTSLLTRICNLLGVELGNNLVPPSKNNPSGFWEHSAIIPLNDEMLGCMNQTYYSTLPFHYNYIDTPKIQVIQEKIIAILKKDLGNCSFWGIKDPRICRLLPFWLEIFEALDSEPYFIIPFRNPLDTINSLLKEGKDSTAAHGHAVVMWIIYNLELEKYSRDYKRSFVHYPDLCNDWKKEMNRISQDLQISWPNWTSLKVDDEVASLINESIINNPMEKTQDILLKNAIYLYEKFLLSLSTNKLDQNEIDDFAKDFYSSCDSILKSFSVMSINLRQAEDKYSNNLRQAQDKYSNNLRQAQDKYSKHKQENLEIQNQLSKTKSQLILTQNQLSETKNELTRTINSILNSRSWRLTKPLRIFKASILKSIL